MNLMYGEWNGINDVGWTKEVSKRYIKERKVQQWQRGQEGQEGRGKEEETFKDVQVSNWSIKEQK